MDLTQSRDIPAPPDTVWHALNDPGVLQRCIPGCESLERVSDSEWRAVVATRVGPVQARFNGRVLLADITPPTGYTLRFEGQGGAAGFASGEAKVSLAPADAGTVLTYVAKARVGGKLAQLGSRLIDGVAAKLADDFFARLAAEVSPPAVEASAATGARPAGDASTSAMAASTVIAPPGGNRWIRYAALVIIIAVLAILYLYRQR